MGRKQHARIQEFLSVLFSPQLIYSLQRGSNVFAEKTILILYQGHRVGPLFSRGGGRCQTFSRGV